MAEIFSLFHLSFDDGAKPEKCEFTDFRWALNAAKGYAKRGNKPILISEKGKVSPDGKYAPLC